MLKRSLKTMTALSLWLVPLAAYAADDSFDVTAAPDQTAAPAVVYNNDVTLGLRWQDTSSALFGRYNGQPDDGIRPFASFNVGGGDAWDSGDTFYYSVQGRNLGYNDHVALPDSSITLKVGQLGSWGLNLGYDNMTYTQSLHFNSANGPSGALILGTAGGVPLANHGAITGGPLASDVGLANPLVAANTLVSNAVAGILPAGGQRVGTQRNTFSVGVTGELFENWTVSGAFSHEHKDGTKENSLVIGSSTSIDNKNASVLAFPEIVDYDTDRFTAMAMYTSEDLQVKLTYVYSAFSENHPADIIVDPFATGLTYAPTVPPAHPVVTSTGFTATYSTPPSSLAHQVNLQVGYNIDPTMRIVGTLQYGLQLQNSAYVARITNPTTALPALPVSSFNGQVESLFGNVTFTARPFTGLDLKLAYTINNRDNESPRVSYGSALWLNDSQDLVSAITINAPYSFHNQKAVAEAGYTIFPQTRLLGGLSWESKSRTYSAVDRNDETSIYGHINSQLTDTITASLSASDSVRTSTTYNGNAPWLALGDNQSSQVDNLGMTHYNEAPRTRTEYGSDVVWAPQNNLAFSFSGRYYSDKYSRSLYGITKDWGLELSPDLTYTASKDLTAHVFYTYEELYYFLNDRVTPGGGGAIFYWTLGTPNTVHTVGVSGDWQATDNLKLNASYTYQHGTTAFNETGNPSGSLGSSPWNYVIVNLPSNKTQINSINFKADYDWSERATLELGYLYEKLTSVDYLNTQPATMPVYANIILAADGSPAYDVNVVTLAVRYRF